MGQINYWWVTRPKRKLNSIPEVLAAFSNVALEAQWNGKRDIHIKFEEELEKDGLKRVGERRDHSGSGGRTYQAWLSSLGLVFIQDSTGIPYLTLAGESIIDGKSPTEVLKAQVLKFQYPSPYSIKTRISDRFKVHPFMFLLKLLTDSRIAFLTEEEIAKVVMIHAENDSDSCLNFVLNQVIRFRIEGDKSLECDFIHKYAPSSGRINMDHPYSHLLDTANTIVNWLEYTQLIIRKDKKILISPERKEEVVKIINQKMPFIKNPENHEWFQRKFGVDPWHQKDTRNLMNTKTITSKIIDTQRIKQTFINYSIHHPVYKLEADIVYKIAERSSVDEYLVEEVLYKNYPMGSIGGFLANYYEMAFKGRDEATDFEMATTNIFRDVFGYKAEHLGQTGNKSAPDILLVSDDDGYQAIIDNKAYSKYSITGDHHNRMVHNYIEKIETYSDYKLPIGFFLYIAGGFIDTFDEQIISEVNESKIPGSGITVANMIKLVETHREHPFSHTELRRLFGLNRQIRLTDFER